MSEAESFSEDDNLEENYNNFLELKTRKTIGDGELPGFIESVDKILLVFKKEVSSLDQAIEKEKKEFVVNPEKFKQLRQKYASIVEKCREVAIFFEKLLERRQSYLEEKLKLLAGEGIDNLELKRILEEKKREVGNRLGDINVYLTALPKPKRKI